MLAAHEGTPLVLRDTAPGLPKKGPPWDIEGEPGGPKIFALKRPYEADNEGDATGHTGHLENQPSHTQSPSAPAPQTSKHHVPWGHTRRRDLPSKSPDVFVLRPIERVRAWNWRRWQRSHLNQHVTLPSHVRHPLRHTACAGQTAPTPSNKESFPLVACKMHFIPVP